MNSNSNKDEIIIKTLNETEKAEIQMKFINKYKDVFNLLEKCNVINHTELVFFADLSERTARRFVNEYLERRVVKINNKITVLDINNPHYTKATQDDEIYKELIGKSTRGSATLLRMKNKAFYIMNSDNREIAISKTKLDNALARAIEYKLKKELDIEENIKVKDFLNQAIRERKKITDEDIKDKTKELLDKDNKLIYENEYYKLVQKDLIMQGYNPNEFFSKFILKKIQINNSAVTIHLNYVFKERSDKNIARDIDIALATIELLKYANYKNIGNRKININLKIYSTTCLNVAHIEKTITHAKRTMNYNYDVLNNEVFQGNNNRKEGGKLYLFYTKLFNRNDKYFIYDEKDKCFKLYY